MAKITKQEFRRRIDKILLAAREGVDMSVRALLREQGLEAEWRISIGLDYLLDQALPSDGSIEVEEAPPGLQDLLEAVSAMRRLCGGGGDGPLFRRTTR